MKLIGLEVDAQQARASFVVSGSDVFALGHYPDNPIFPGVLTAEHLCTVAQALGTGVAGRAVRAASIKRVQYLDAIVPGDVVEVIAQLKSSTAQAMEIAVSAQVAGKAKTRGIIVCRPVEADFVAPAQTLPVVDACGEGRVEHRALGAVLPHRYPFLLVDRVLTHQPGQSILASKIVTPTLPQLLQWEGEHYPQGLAVESIGQAGIALFFLSRTGQPPQDIVLGSVSDVEFLAPIPMHSALSLSARIDRLLPNGVMFSGEARIGERVVTRVGCLLAMVDPRRN